MNNDNYCDFMDKIFSPWYKFQSQSFKVKCLFMHDNVPSHVSKLTREFFEHKNFTGEMIEWLPPSPDLSQIENLWSIVKLK